MYRTGGGREYSSRETDDMQRVFVSESDRVRASQRAKEEQVRQSQRAKEEQVRQSQRAKEEEQVRQLACPPRGSGNLTML